MNNIEFVAVLCAVHSFSNDLYIRFLQGTKTNEMLFGCLYYAIVTFNNKFTKKYLYECSLFFFGARMSMSCWRNFYGTVFCFCFFC